MPFADAILPRRRPTEISHSFATLVPRVGQDKKMYCPLPSPNMPPDFMYARLSHRKNKAQKLSAPPQSGAQARVFANVPNRSGLCCERRSNMGVKEGREGEMCVRIIRLTKARRHWKGRGNSVRSRQTIRMRGGGGETAFPLLFCLC